MIIHRIPSSEETRPHNLADDNSLLRLLMNQQQTKDTKKKQKNHGLFHLLYTPKTERNILKV